MMKKLHHFYHIYAAGDWKQPLHEHLRGMIEYGLYYNLDTFNVGIVGSQEQCVSVEAYLTEQKIRHNIIATAESGWEQVTMIPMWEFSQKNDGLILYAHTKGSSNASDVNIRWRRSMIWHNVCHWREAVNELSTRSHAYGCHWIAPLISGMPEHKVGNMMFAGTFFWMRSEVMARHPKPALTHRWEAEGFCGYGWHEKAYPIFDPTPYFPNTGPFADGWVEANGVGYKPEFHLPKFYDV